MEEQHNLEQENKSMLIDEEGKQQLLEARNWSFFLAVAGFIFLGLFFVIMLVTLGTSGNHFPGSRGLAIIPGILLIIIYFFPLYYLYRFSVIAKEAITVKGIYKLSDAFNYLRMHYKFLGILFIILMAFYIIVILMMLIMGTPMFHAF